MPHKSKSVHKHQHHHHQHRPFFSTWWWFWCLIGVLLFILFIMWIASAGGDYHHPHHTHSAAVAGGDPFVFKRHGGFPLAKKRTVASECKSGERWDKDVGMCAPIPQSFVDAITNANVSACDSFFENMCGTWIKEHTNEDRSFSYGYHRNQKLVERIITGAHEKEGIAQFYQSCKTVSIQQESELEFRHLSDMITGGIRTFADLPSAFGKLARHGYTNVFAFSIEKHPLEPVMLPFFSWDGFDNLTQPIISETYDKTRVITRFTVAQILSKVERVVRLSAALRARKDPDVADYYQYVNTTLRSHLGPYSGLPKWNWKGYFQALDGTALKFTPDQTVWNASPRYMEWLMREGITSFQVEDWKTYIEFSLLYNGHNFEPDLPNNAYFREWDKHGPIGVGARIYHRLPRGRSHVWKRTTDECVRITQHMLPGLVARTFLDGFDKKDEIKQDARAMVKSILATFAKDIQDTPWLSPAAKEVAIKKIAAIVIRVAEPTEWEVEPFAPRLSADRFDHNMNLIRRYRVQRNLQLWHRDTPKALDRNAIAFFAAPLMDINAYYSPTTNTITLLAGILQRPFYDPTYSATAKRAILGSIIGHELGHVLDDDGIRWDHDGSLRLEGIWPKEDILAYKTLTQRVAKEFGPPPAECKEAPAEYGTATLNEDLADLIGLHMSLGSLPADTSVGDKQTFFRAFSQIWCNSYDTAHKCKSVASDLHAIAEYRVDHTLRNLPEFATAFSCPAKSKMRAANPIKVFGQ